MRYYIDKSRRAFMSGIVAIALLGRYGYGKANEALSKISKISDIYVPRKKFALVIANRDYPNGKDLPPAYKNAADIQEALEYLEFKVTSYTDLNHESMQLVLKEFIQQMRSISEGAPLGSVAVVFYFFGHGFQTSGQNYLVPAGIDPSSQDAVSKSFKLMDDIINKLPNRYPGITIALIDACRTDPLVRKGVDDFTQIVVPEGTIVFFATRAGRPALSPIDEKVNTFFTGTLVDAFQKANGVTPIDDLFQIVATKCLNQVSKILEKFGLKYLPQYPESTTNLRGKFVIRNRILELNREKKYQDVSEEELQLAKEALEAQKAAGAKVPEKPKVALDSKKLEKVQKLVDAKKIEERWAIIQQTIKPKALVRLCEEFIRDYPGAEYAQVAEVILVGSRKALDAQRIAALSSDNLEDQAGNADYRDDLVKALRGDKDSAYRIALMYRGGSKLSALVQQESSNGLLKNERRAEQWLKFSAELGNGIASWQLAEIYNGTGQQADAAKYERLAIELGYTPPPRLANRGY